MPQQENTSHDNQEPRVRSSIPSQSMETREVKRSADPIGSTGVLAKPSFSERCRTHRFWLVRAIYMVVRSVWMVVMVVGGFIVWLIAMLFI